MIDALTRSKQTTAPPHKNSEEEFQNYSPMTYALIASTVCLICLVIAVVITKIKTPKVEIGRIFRNSFYGRYYIENERIDQNVVEIADQNPNYRRNNDDINETVFQDVNQKYGSENDNNDQCETAELEDDDYNMSEPIVDDDGYARLPIRA